MQVVEKSKLHRAIGLAQNLFAPKRRKNGEPYFNHCYNVMKILETHGFHGDILVAAILHDVYEDTLFSSKNVREQFGEQTDFFIQAVSKAKYKGTKTGNLLTPRFTAYFFQIKEYSIIDSRVIFIKMADIIDNLRTVDIFKSEKILRKKTEIKECFLPFFENIANTYMTSWQKTKYQNIKAEIVELL